MTRKRTSDAAMHPLTLWRISNYLSLSGEGGMEIAGRWHSIGRPIVYFAASPPGTLLEVLVHLEFEADEFPDHYQLLRVSTAAPMEVRHIVPAKENWQSNQTSTQRLGDEWLAEESSPLACVPSAIMPQTWNYLFNPLHREAHKLRIEESTRHPYDPRLLRKKR